MDRDQKASVEERLRANQASRERYQKGRMELLDKFMPMPPDAPYVPPMMLMPAPRLQDIINANKIPSPTPAQPTVPIIGTRG
jgi:hypothetical protein